jgi:L-glyceraldehyde 3-phosphate reductase
MYITPAYQPDEKRYERMQYQRTGRSGLLLPRISLGLWHNFGGVDSFENGRAILRKAFDLGVTHFDLANNYGPPYGSAEETFGKAFQKDLKPFRDEMVISSKAGWDMWPGPYGDHGSRKYLMASLDQSLRRMGLDYVDIFYHHRPDPETPLEETMGALADIVRSGKALYAGISSYEPERTEKAADLLAERYVPLLIHQPVYSMFNRHVEAGLLSTLETRGIGCIVFSPLAQGLLTDRYLAGIPGDSRAARPQAYLGAGDVTPAVVEKVRKLNDLAKSRGQSMAQMAIAWVLRQPAVTSALVGASSPRQIEDTVHCLDRLDFGADELGLIDSILAG